MALLAVLVHLRPPHAANPELDVANDKAWTLSHGVSIAIASLLWATARRVHGRVCQEWSLVQFGAVNLPFVGSGDSWMFVSSCVRCR